MTLRLDWATHDAARYAVTRWHYTGSMPTPPLVRVGAWERGHFIGVVLFSRGATPALGRPYGLRQTELCELTRVALREHDAPVTQVVAGALRMLARHAPGLRLVVSFADPYHGHLGRIYQAGNWFYLGRTADARMYRDAAGRLWHGRQVSRSGFKAQYGTVRRVPKIADCERLMVPGKHRYAYPLDRRMRAQLAALAQPYPRAPEVSTADTLRSHRRGAGSTPARRSSL